MMQPIGRIFRYKGINPRKAGESMKRIFVFILVGLTLATTACQSNPEQANREPVSAVASVKPPDVPAEGLNAVQETINVNWEKFRDEQSIEIMMSAVLEDSIEMQIRSYGDAEEALSEQDVEAFKTSLYELAGHEFPVTILLWKCCEGEPFVIAKITQVNSKDNRILVASEHEKNGNSDDPLAYWVGLTKDGKVHSEGEVSERFDSSMIGKEARIWTTGMVDQSYPAQVAAIKVVVESLQD
jgi:hypothetical protein